MDFEDSRNALFPEPNAYIQHFKKEDCQTKKVVFQEPYDTLPSFYINNDFKKGDCNCVPNQKSPNKHDCNCSPFPPNFNDNGQKNEHQHEQNQQNSPQFNLGNLLPMLGGMGNSSNGLGGILNMLGGGLSGLGGSSGLDLSKIISGLGSGGLSNILNLFKDKQNNKTTQKAIQSTNTNIKNFTRVD